MSFHFVDRDDSYWESANAHSENAKFFFICSTIFSATLFYSPENVFSICNCMRPSRIKINFHAYFQSFCKLPDSDNLKVRINVVCFDQ